MAKYRVITEDSAVAFTVEADTFVPDYDNSEYAFVKGEEVVARVSIYRTVGVVKQ